MSEARPALASFSAVPARQRVPVFLRCAVIPCAEVAVRQQRCRAHQEAVK